MDDMDWKMKKMERRSVRELAVLHTRHACVHQHAHDNKGERRSVLILLFRQFDSLAVTQN